MFADVLFSANPPVLSHQDNELASQFIPWRSFGFSQLKQGNLALWNPHVFCGIPFFGSFQSALLYPPNFLYMVLPLGLATNVCIVLHIFLTGLFMYLWAWYRGLRPPACFLAAVLLMFCGPYFMHIYAGHLSNLCTMAWIPLIFLSIDGICNKRTLAWVLLGIASVTMLILAGHPQHVFYTVIAAAIYCALSLLNQQQRGRILVLLALMAVWGGLLASVQLLTALEEAAYTVRGKGGVEFEFAAMFSFPPENLMTLLAPGFLGSLHNHSYWGRGYLWEMSMFFSVTGLILAVYGRVHGSRKQRHYSMTLIIILFILALGAHTPLFRLLYGMVPGFDKFRGSSKFIFQMMLFVAMLAGVGLHQLITSNSRPSLRWILGIAAGAVVLIVVANSITMSVSESGMESWWHNFMKTVCSAANKSSELYLDPNYYDDSMFVRSAALCASNSLLVTAGLLVLLTALLALVRWWKYAVYTFVLLALLELVLFALPLRPTFDLMAVQLPAELRNIVYSQSADYRILNTINKNSAMTNGLLDIWGYDPGTLRRYAQFMAFTQAIDPDKATQYVGFSNMHRLFSMLRLQYVILRQDSRTKVLTMTEPPLPRLLLVRDFQVLKDRDSILHALASPAFDLHQTVVLESPPKPLPQPSRKIGTAKIIDESTDCLTIEADIDSPAILLLTDAYHPNWHAEPLPGSCQKSYQLMPANYVLRAVPLEAGRHRFRIEYRPQAFRIGLWISIISLAAYLALCLWWLYSFYSNRYI